MPEPGAYPYETRLNILFPPLALIDLQPLVDACTFPWYNQTLCRVNDSVVRLGVMQGEYHWHQHDQDDEFFYVVAGEFLIDLEGRTVTLEPRQGFVVPRGVRHRTRAPVRSVVLMVETAAILPTGDGGSTAPPAGRRSRRADVFFYGFFMDPDLLREKGFAPEGAELASVSGFALRIGQRAALAREPAGRVYGSVMSLTLAELERLYAEPSLTAYRPEPVLAELASGGVVAALCYNLPQPPAADEYNPAYAARLRAAAQKIGLPAEYVRSLP